jgi:hypothetical protein
MLRPVAVAPTFSAHVAVLAQQLSTLDALRLILKAAIDIERRPVADPLAEEHLKLMHCRFACVACVTTGASFDTIKRCVDTTLEYFDNPIVISAIVPMLVNKPLLLAEIPETSRAARKFLVEAALALLQ